MAQQFYLAAITLVLLDRLPASTCSSQVLPTDLEPPPGTGGLYNLTVENFPWHAYVTAGESVCSGTIIHNSWVMLLSSCDIVQEKGSGIKVHAGGATPDQVRQAVNAEIYPGNGQADWGFALLQLNKSLEFDEYVQPARIGRPDLGVQGVFSIAAVFSFTDNQIQLKAYLEIYNRTLCPEAGFLCALRVGLPSVQSTLGIDFLEVVDYQDIGGEIYTCLIAGKMETIGIVLDKFYPIADALPWLQDKTGLKFVPKPPASKPDLPARCGLLQ